MVSNCLFYIFAFGLIAATLTVIFSRRIYSAIISASFFFLLTGILYLFLNSVLTSIFQLLICGFLLLGLLIAAYRQINEEDDIEDNKPQIVKKMRVFLCPVLIAVFVHLTALLVFYFTKLQPEEALLYSVEDIVLSKGMTFIVNIKTIFADYILAYVLVGVLLFASIIGAGLLISKNKGGDNG